MGSTTGWSIIKLPMGAPYTRKKSGRDSFVPVKIEQGKVYPKDYHGSAHIQALTSADGFIMIPMGIINIEEGTSVDVRQI